MKDKDGDEGAGTMSQNAVIDFTGFYEQWFAKVYNYARHRTGSAARADEIAADTFERVFRSWTNFDPVRGDRRTWLFTIAFRSVADHYRSEKREVWSSLELESEVAEHGDGPPQLAEEAQEKRNLIKALASLEEQAREVVSLRFFSGMTNRAIAELLGLSESNVAVILFRSVRKMRRGFPGAEA